MKKEGFTRFQKILPILSNLTAFIAQFGLGPLAPVLEITRLAAMTTLNSVNLVQSIKQKNKLNIVWNSAFLGMDVTAGLGIMGQNVLRRTTLLRKEESLLARTADVREELSTATHRGTNVLKSQADELSRLLVSARPTSMQRLGDPSQESFLATEKKNLGEMGHLLTRQTEGLQRDFQNLSHWDRGTLSRYQAEQLEPSLLQRPPQELSADPKSFRVPRFLEKRQYDISTLINESENSLNQLQKAESKLRAVHYTRVLNRANNLFTNVKDYAVLEQQNSRQSSVTSTGLHSTEAFLGGL